MIPRGKPFSAVDDLPSLEGKCILITGGTSGIGRACLLGLAIHKPSRIIFTGRNRVNAREVVQEVQQLSPESKVDFLPLDHSSVVSVLDAIEKLLREGELNRLDILICNAGTMACPAIRTAEGYDVQFATNFVSHSMIIHMLLPTLINTKSTYQGDVRIVIQTSEAYMLHPPGGINWAHVKTDPKSPPHQQHLTRDRMLPWDGEWMRFAESQLASLLFATELARGYPQLITLAVMPAAMSDTKLIRTNSLANRLLIHAVEPVLPAEAGAQSLLWAAASTRYHDEIVNGGYYQAVAIGGWHVRESRNKAIAERVWEWSRVEFDSYQNKLVT